MYNCNELAFHLGGGSFILNADLLPVIELFILYSLQLSFLQALVRISEDRLSAVLREILEKRAALPISHYF